VPWQIYLESLGRHPKLMSTVAQHSLANGQVKKRCSMVSSSSVSHTTQRASSWISRCHLLSIVLVLSRSTRTSHTEFDPRGAISISIPPWKLDGLPCCRRCKSINASKLKYYPRWISNDPGCSHHTAEPIVVSVSFPAPQELSVKVATQIGCQDPPLASLWRPKCYLI
jgi:hypothetical protein